MSFVEKFETLCEELQIMAADGELSREHWAKTNLRSNMYVTSLPGSPNADRWNACAFAIATAMRSVLTRPGGLRFVEQGDSYRGPAESARRRPGGSPSANQECFRREHHRVRFGDIIPAVRARPP